MSKSLKKEFVDSSKDAPKPLIDMKTLNESVISPHNINHNEEITITAYVDPETNDFKPTNYEDNK